MLLQRLVSGQKLSLEDAAKAVEMALDGSLTPVQTAALLAVLRARGETFEELVGVTKVLRTRALKVKVPRNLHIADTCGTGGDGTGTFNVSTAVALVVAGTGLPVAKHGNRGVSSASGSADVLQALGVRVAMPTHVAVQCLLRTGMTFLYAPHYHPALRDLASLRRELGIRTILNLAGPLANPLRPLFQIIGVPEPNLVPVVAKALALLGDRRALVVHGDGMDELSPFGTNVVAFIAGRRWRMRTLGKMELLPDQGTLPDIQVADASESADLIRSVLAGVGGPARNIVVLNAAALLWVAGRSPTLRDAITAAQESIDSGRAARVLMRLIDESNREDALGHAN